MTPDKRAELRTINHEIALDLVENRRARWFPPPATPRLPEYRPLDPEEAARRKEVQRVYRAAARARELAACPPQPRPSPSMPPPRPPAPPRPAVPAAPAVPPKPRRRPGIPVLK